MNDQPYGYHPTTTHAEWGSGSPHLRITGLDEERLIFQIVVDQVTIGSDEASTLQFPGADPLHATIVHDQNDEYVLTMHGPGRMHTVREHGEVDDARTAVLRTGAHFTIGDWLLVFGREEYADHGRPYGGRPGGEGAHQERQPDRPDYPVTAPTAVPAPAADTSDS